MADATTRLGVSHRAMMDILETVPDLREGPQLDAILALLDQRRTLDLSDLPAGEQAQLIAARTQELLDEADTISDILEIEEQISSRQAELEAMQARQRVLADQTSYATVDVELRLPSSAVPVDDGDSPGFVGGLAAGWRALLTVVDVVVVVIGWLLPFTVVAAAAAAENMTPLQLARFTFIDEQGGNPAHRIVSAPRLEGCLSALVSTIELQVVKLFVDGQSYKEIASRRGTSPRTIANQLSSVFRKAGISGRPELLVYLATHFQAKAAL